ncbi:FAD/FMN-containing dehydrogenase [Diaminobutyricimonas aerilata]|uniref:FAD/FMN-containing dehydrogenase n=1 Tax=Diaminobutyricimonas aerilata TaxID=1162967 RepID=A0A2M9CMK2_9MICO|nr:FAD-binding oxidoreductase [Diaminobutyricimonas aerilata]PJJ73074.1 FAD/FMN-containing dehydrogenase [Diaminobutyricimonas aerilata]
MNPTHSSDAGVVDDLITGYALSPGDPGWDDAALPHSAHGAPTRIARPRSADEVAVAVRYATARDLGVAVRSGGHGAMAFSAADAVLIDLGGLDTIEVREEGIVQIGGGATWGAIADELGRHGLALTSGDTRSVGVGGLTLGGGIGWMVREHGLALDQLVGAQVVLASGEIVEASETEHPDLFWALRGGGGNFGVVTRFDFRAHPVTGVVFGTLAFGADRLVPLMRVWRDVMRDAPERLTTTLVAMPSFGEAPPTVQLVVCWGDDDVAAADAALAPLRALPGLLSDDVGTRAYAEVLEDPHGPEGPITVVDHNSFWRELDDDGIALVAAAHADTAPSVLMIRYLRGASSRVDPAATAFAHRSAEVLVIAAAFVPADAGGEVTERIRGVWAGLERRAIGRYGNFSLATGEATVAAMYPRATLDRLREVKRRYDPANLFDRNHNVVPVGA